MKRAILTVITGCLLATWGRADDQMKVVIKDTFAVNEMRKANDPLAGTVTELGDRVWSGPAKTSPLLASDFRVVTNPEGDDPASNPDSVQWAYCPLDGLDGTTWSVKADLVSPEPDGGWVAVQFGSKSVWGAQLLFMVRNDNVGVLYGEGNFTGLGSFNCPPNAGDVGEFRTLELVYDSTENRVTCFCDGVMVFEKVLDFTPTTGDYAGFILAGKSAGRAATNFQVSVGSGSPAAN